MGTVFRLAHEGVGSLEPRNTAETVDTIKMLAQDRHFQTADIHLAAYGRVVMIGDQAAVERLVGVIQEHAQHELVSIESEPE